MRLIKKIILGAIPQLANIIKKRDELFSENELLKSRVIELSNSLGGNIHLKKATELNSAFMGDASLFSVAVFDPRAIPGKKGG